MTDYNRLHRLISILKESKYPVPRTKLQEEIEIGKSRFYEIIKQLQDEFGAPIHSERNRGYILADKNWEMPWNWLTVEEVSLLLSIKNLINNDQHLLLGPLLKPFEQRIQKVLQDNQIDEQALSNNIKISAHAYRKVDSDAFQKLSQAILNKQTLNVQYTDNHNQTTTRDISPQRLCRYRDNWYLDLYCHLKQSHRLFRIEEISHIKDSQQTYQDMPAETLNDIVLSSYGIFSGKAKHTAVLQFHPPHAKRVSKETWHPDQQQHWVSEQVYQLELPYNHSAELEMDIMRYLPHVDVIAPESLRKNIQEKLKKSQKRLESPEKPDKELL